MCVPLLWVSVLLDCIDSDLAVLNEKIYKKDHNLCKGSGIYR